MDFLVLALLGLSSNFLESALIFLKNYGSSDSTVQQHGSIARFNSQIKPCPFLRVCLFTEMEFHRDGSKNRQ